MAAVPRSWSEIMNVWIGEDETLYLCPDPWFLQDNDGILAWGDQWAWLSGLWMAQDP